MEEHAKPVVLDAAEAVSALLDLLDQQVKALGQAVAGTVVVVRDRSLRATLEGLAEGADLLDVVGTPAIVLSITSTAPSGTSVR